MLCSFSGGVRAAVRADRFRVSSTGAFLLGATFGRSISPSANESDVADVEQTGQITSDEISGRSKETSKLWLMINPYDKRQRRAVSVSPTERRDLKAGWTFEKVLFP
jgi:hypothetical protein